MTTAAAPELSRARRLLGSYERLVPYVVSYRRRLAIGGVCLVVTNAMTGAIPWLTMRAIDRIAHGAPHRDLTLIVLAIVVMAFVMSVIRTKSRLEILGVSRRIAYDMRRDLYRHLLRVRSSAFDTYSTGDIMSRLTNDLMLVRGLTGPGFMYLLNTVMAYLTALSFMGALDPYLTMVSIVPFPFFVASVWLLSRRIHLRQKETQEGLASLSSRVQEDLNGVWVVKAHAREAFAIDAYEVMNTAYADANMRLVLVRSILSPIMGMVGGVGTLLVLTLGGLAVVDGDITLGGFVAFTGYLGMIAAPTVQMGWVITLFQRARVATTRIDEIMALDTEDAGPVVGERLQGDVEVRGLSFTYPGARSAVLEGLSFHVPAGETVAIYGATGSGKSTILKILTRLYDPPPGTVFVGGRDVASAPLGLVRASIGYVPQDPFLFRASVRENVAFATDGADGAVGVEEAARIAAVHEEMEGLPQGYDTPLGERGITLSGGQRARVTLARALFERRPLLALDDPFASVDVSTEHEIIGRLQQRALGITTILVTHRVKALANAHRILVLDRGRIVDHGSHEELLERPGPYLDAFHEQKLVEELQAL